MRQTPRCLLAALLLSGGAAIASPWPAVAPPLAPDPALEQRVETVLGAMSLEEKVGQVIQAEIKYATPADVRKYHLGALLNGGGTAPGNDKTAPVSAWVELADAYYRAAMDTSDGGQAIPPLWGSDAVHGHNNVRGATIFPHNIGLGAARDPDLIRRIGAATAREVRATGLNWTFAPTVAVVRDIRWGRTYESYAEDPELVARYARAMVTGIQGEPGTQAFLDDGHVLATAKHYVGDGGTERGVDRGDTRVDEAELARIHGAGFITALEAGVQTVMASFNSWNGEKVHASHHLLTGVLKDQLGFDGLVVSDWNAHRQLPGCTVERCARAIGSGIDLQMVPSDWKALYRNTLAQVRDEEITRARLDDAVRRILRIKFRAGLFDQGPPSGRDLAGRGDLLGHPEHRALAAEAVRKSLVLLKNNGSVLPLDPGARILVAGDGANDVAKQSGGWTLTWQGTGNQRSDFPNASTLYEGIAAAVQAAGGEVALSENGEWQPDLFAGGARPDAVIAIYGEDPYAEWHGDIASIEYQRGSKRDLAMLRELRVLEAPIVSVFLSGRPLWVNRELNASDAFVAAWLPGSEGGAVADVLFRRPDGAIDHDFTGRLSFSWPRYVHQAVLNVGDPDYDPLFRYGYGLDYQSPPTGLPQLPEDGDTYLAGQLDELWLFVSRVNDPWQMRLRSGDGEAVTATGNRAASNDRDDLTAAAIDRVSQEDARALSWRAGVTGSVSLSAPLPQNLSAYIAEDAALSLLLRRDTPLPHPLRLGMDCGPDCGASLDLNEALAGAPEEQWQPLTIDLACFADMDFSQVLTPFRLTTTGPATLAIAEVKLIPGTATDANLRCGDQP